MRTKKFLALLLSAAIVITAPVQTGASQLSQEQISGASEGTAETSSGVSGNAGSLSENTVSGSESGIEASENNARPVSSDSSGDVVTVSGEEVNIKELAEEKGATDEQIAVSREIVANFSDLSELRIDKDYDRNRIVFEADSKEEAETVAAEYGGKLTFFEYGVGAAELTLGAMSLSEKIDEAAATCSMDTVVYPSYIYYADDYTEEKAALTDNYSVSSINDSMYSKQWFHSAINNEEAWTKTKGSGAVVGVLDTGISLSHPDLQTNIIGSESTCEETNAEDGNGHGSNCAGIIAAVANNGRGGAGVAPEAKIYAVKVLNSEGSGNSEYVAAGIRAATEYGVNVISMSLGSYGSDSLQQRRINEAAAKGITCVAAAGNGIVLSNGSQTGVATNMKSYPAACKNCVAVAAYDESNALTYFSNYGSWVDIAAPGYNIYSCSSNSAYVWMNGTSQATPVVAGVAALIYANNPAYIKNETAATANAVAARLKSTSDGYTYSLNGHSVKGGVDAAAAVGVAETAYTAPAKPVIKQIADPLTGYVTVSMNKTDYNNIYYTLDGTKPYAGSNVYTGPFILDNTYRSRYTVKAVGVKNVNSIPVTSAVTAANVTVRTPSNVNTAVTGLVSDAGTSFIVLPGKTIKLGISVKPSNAKDKRLVYSASGSSSITVTSGGTVKVSRNAKAGDSSTVTVSLNSTKTTKLDIAVKVATSTVSQVAASVGTVEIKTNGASAYELKYVLNPAPSSTCIYRFSSSNTRAATVDASGNVKAAGNGKATITATLMDGSGKNVKIRFNCTTPVVKIALGTSTGINPYIDAKTDSTKLVKESYIGQGCSITLKPFLYGYNTDTGYAEPSDRRLTWTSNSSYITVENGKVSCSSTASVGSTATVTAAAADGSGQKASFTFTVCRKTYDVKYELLYTYLYYYYGWRTSYSYRYSSSVTAKGKLGSTIDLSDPETYINPEVQKFSVDNHQLIRLVTRNSYVNYDSSMFSISVPDSPNVVIGSKSAAGFPTNVRFTKKGTYKIVYTVLDGTGKKFTVNLKVR